jgi:hypothetical protein
MIFGSGCPTYLGKDQGCQHGRCDIISVARRLVPAPAVSPSLLQAKVPQFFEQVLAGPVGHSSQVAAHGLILICLHDQSLYSMSFLICPSLGNISSLSGAFSLMRSNMHILMLSSSHLATSLDWPANWVTK